MLFKKVIDWGRGRPQRLFWVDGGGAALSALLLGLVLAPKAEWVGLPASSLSFLAMVAVGLVGYDVLAYCAKAQYWPRLLWGCVLLNASYGLLTSVLLFYHRQTLTALGLGYFLLETGVIALLATLEWRVASGSN